MEEEKDEIMGIGNLMIKETKKMIFNVIIATDMGI